MHTHSHTPIHTPAQCKCTNYAQVVVHSSYTCIKLECSLPVWVHGWFPHEYSHSHYAGDVDLASIHREVVLQWRILLVQTRQDVESTPQNKIAVLHSTNAITGPDTRRAICAKYICMGDAETARSSAFLWWSYQNEHFAGVTVGQQDIDSVTSTPSCSWSHPTVWIFTRWSHQSWCTPLRSYRKIHINPLLIGDSLDDGVWTIQSLLEEFDPHWIASRYSSR